MQCTWPLQAAGNCKLQGKGLDAVPKDRAWYRGTCCGEGSHAPNGTSTALLALTTVVAGTALYKATMSAPTCSSMNTRTKPSRVATSTAAAIAWQTPLIVGQCGQNMKVPSPVDPAEGAAKAPKQTLCAAKRPCTFSLMLKGEAEHAALLCSPVANVLSTFPQYCH
jgi:hypothetical protein